MTEAAQQALSILRDAEQFNWYVIPLLAFTFYVYTVEAERKNWNLILAGLAFGVWIGSMRFGTHWSFISPVMPLSGEHRGGTQPF
jgi:hypothetical protein